MRRTDRREILGWSAALALGAALGGRASARSALVRSCGAGPDLDDTLRWVMTTPRDPVLKRAARELHAGMDPGHLLGALLVAASRDIRTDRSTINHSVLSVSAIDQLTQTADRAERERDALWCLDYFKESQEREGAGEEWHMAPLEAAKLPSGDKARTALVDALEHWDVDAADVAIAGWARSAPLDEVWALVWEYGLRCGVHGGHKVIHAALSRRALPLAGDRYAEDVLRSVVSMLLSEGRTEFAEPFERSRELVKSELAPRANAHAPDPVATRELLAELRTSEPDAMPAKVAEMIRAGAAPAALWDAIVTAACEVAVADIGIGPLHALTSTNSVHHIARNAASPRVEMLALLQGAAWVADFHRRLPKEAAGVRIESLDPAEGTLESIVIEDRRSLSTARGGLWLARDPERFLDSARNIVRTKGDDVHEFKLVAAALEEARWCSAATRPFACAALAVYLPAPGRTDRPRLQRIGDARAMASAR